MIALWTLALLMLAAPSVAAEPLTPLPVSGRDARSVSEVLPADVLARTHLVAAEVDLVRTEMGRPRTQRSPFKVTGAAPREVYFEAVSLFMKAEQLAFELTGQSAGQP